VTHYLQPFDTMKTRTTLSILALVVASFTFGQAAKLHVGKAFSRIPKNTTGDVYAVMSRRARRLMKEALLYVEDNMVAKSGDAWIADHEPCRRTGAAEPTLSTPCSWTGVAPFVADGTLHCLLASNTKKTTEYAIGQAVDTTGCARP
jgi:hypothetical protein